jgi:hypothetical protein
MRSNARLIPAFGHKENRKMDGLNETNKDGTPDSFLSVYIRYTHLDVSVFADILKGIYKIHQTIVGALNNTFMFSDVYKDGVRNVLHIDSVATGNSLTLKIREGWAPAFQPASDDFLVEIPTVLGIPAIMASLLISTLEKTVLQNSNFLEGPKKALKKEIAENKDGKALFNAVQESNVNRTLHELVLSWIQSVKSIDAVRSVSINGVNMLSFDVNRRKFKRYFVNLPIQISVNDDTVNAVIVNISRGGCVFKFNESKKIRSDRDFSVQFSGCVLKPSAVSTWQSSGQSFVRAIFDPPMEENQFNEIMNRG